MLAAAVQEQEKLGSSLGKSDGSGRLVLRVVTRRPGSGL
jgi:hypothetical protein